MEATGYSRWFERLLAELGFELWIGDPAEIKAKRVNKQKFDREDARLLLRLLRENNFPQIWIPDAENRDLRQLLWHRHRLVQMRTRIMNQLQALAMNEGYRWKKKLFSEQGRAQLEKLASAPWASRRRQELLELFDRMNPAIEELTAAVEREVRKRPEAMRLMTHPGVGPLTALAYVLIIGTPMRFQRGKQIGTYVGMIPCEAGHDDRRRNCRHDRVLDLAGVGTHYRPASFCGWRLRPLGSCAYLIWTLRRLSRFTAISNRSLRLAPGGCDRPRLRREPDERSVLAGGECAQGTRFHAPRPRG
jgi:transposase